MTRRSQEPFGESLDELERRSCCQLLLKDTLVSVMTVSPKTWVSWHSYVYMMPKYVNKSFELS